MPLALCSFLFFGNVHAEENNFYKGDKAEEIDGALHVVNYLYGSPMYTNSESMTQSLGVTLYPEDRISYFPDPSYGLGSKIVVQRANVVTVSDAGVETTYRTWKNTVREVLEENHVSIGDKDTVDVSLDQKISSLAYDKTRGVVAREGRNEAPLMGKINITRVAETEIKERENISFSTTTKKDPDMERGTTRVDTAGENGIRELTYLVRRENGSEISRSLVKTEVTKEPIDKIIYEGTKVVVYGTGAATWYDLIGGMTAASNSLPYGTMVHVVNTENGKSVDVKIVDHGIQGSAVIDLSSEAFQQIASLSQGTAKVRIEKP
jgi:hypothetical protein